MKKNGMFSNFLIIWSSFVLTFLLVCFFNINIFFKGTHAYFGNPDNGTGTLGGEIYSVYYYRNHPDIISVEFVQDKKYNITQVLSYEELFEGIDGYRFIGWNSLADGTGNSFDVGHVFQLTANVNLYAQWKKIINYGDANEDGIVDESDYLLVEKYIDDNSLLVDNALLNADVNEDGKVNEVDVDIIKQACLGTPTYVGYLPNKPILVYELYEGNIDIGNDDLINNDGEIDDEGDEPLEDNNKPAGDGTGNGEGGNGSSNKGNGNNNNLSNSGNNSSSDDLVNDNSNEEKRDPKTFIFKYIYNGKEYANTKCETISENCELVLPEKEPYKKGYKFDGWSKAFDCLDENKILAPRYVDSSNTYYACFSLDSDIDDNNISLVWVIVTLMCIISIRIICYLICKFRESNKKEIKNGE